MTPYVILVPSYVVHSISKKSSIFGMMSIFRTYIEKSVFLPTSISETWKGELLAFLALLQELISTRSHGQS